MTRRADEKNLSGSAASSAATATTIWAWIASSGDFFAASAVRIAPDTYELIDAPDGSDFAPGDHVKCELSDGELVVRERVFRTRLL